MADTPEQAELRRHLAELRSAAHGLGRDLELKVEGGARVLEQKISTMPEVAADDLRGWFQDIDGDFRALGRVVDDGLSKIPGRVANAGSAIAAAAARVGAATKGGLLTAGKKTREGTKNVLAAAAGVRRTPMKEWHPPQESGSSSGEE